MAKTIRRKVIEAEYMGSNLGGQQWYLTLECGHSLDWGHHNAHDHPQTTRCHACETEAESCPRH